MDEYELQLKFSALYPMVDNQETPLPKCWNNKDKYRFLLLNNFNLRVHYRGSGELPREPGSIRATHPIPPACGLYYFEIKVIGEGKYVAVGLSNRKSNLNNLPGWEISSFGYYCKNGQIFHALDNHKNYGPKYTSGDTIGCGVNFFDRKIFFTKNGHYLGTAFEHISLNIPLFPTVGMQNRGEIIEANFGHKEFLFNTDFIIDEIKHRVRISIENYPLVRVNQHKLILSYLEHQGYIESALAFARLTNQNIDSDFQSVKNRQNILNLIRLGKIDRAIELVNETYPNFLKYNEDLHFKLLCRQFIESLNEQPQTVEQYSSHNINTNSISNQIIIKQDFSPTNSINMYKIINFGKKIYKFNEKLINLKSYNACTKKMKEAFSLLAYNDPHSSSMNWLFDNVQRENLCFELNSRIQKYLKKPTFNILDIAASLTKDFLYLLAEDQSPTAAFINWADFLN